ncbi:4Fe-4S binding protein [uncultured Mediterranea sp.]|uniref:4Fe-4S binding protein n=1 Tax=uncultured Mediterranea sp. TaxID=1926662 RepID=UPI0027D95E11|nr:4Fe-4S binding protein [uncultured Mediterranea sp.]
MTVNAINLITFSPTHTSKQIGEAIVRGMGIADVSFVDMTLQTPEQKEFGSDVLAVITVPVYGGHVAPLALERMKDLRADGTPAVIVMVYGNRAYEKALTELDAFVSGLGFKVIAGGTFVGEHSYSSDRYPIAAGRPDDDDLKFAEEFGAKVRIKLSNAADAEHLYGVDVQKIQRPKQPFLPLFRFLRRVIKLRKSGVPMPRTPQVDEKLCTHCGLCVKRCPAGAIVKGEECVTNAEKCIRCCACVKGCPQKARTFDTPFAALLHDCFQRPKENRIIL